MFSKEKSAQRTYTAGQYRIPNGLYPRRTFGKASTLKSLLGSTIYLLEKTRVQTEDLKNSSSLSLHNHKSGRGNGQVFIEAGFQDHPKDNT
ncbi:unnamed protein product, partial [Mesorhabditis spiculigera]